MAFARQVESWLYHHHAALPVRGIPLLLCALTHRHLNASRSLCMQACKNIPSSFRRENIHDYFSPSRAFKTTGRLLAPIELTDKYLRHAADLFALLEMLRLVRVVNCKNSAFRLTRAKTPIHLTLFYLNHLPRLIPAIISALSDFRKQKCALIIQN